MREITSEASYEAIFSQKTKVNGEKWREDALRYALDVRKFEIELYWKRATYFWTLIAASFAGYFALQSTEINKRDNLSVFIITCIGFVLSASWYMANRGSKYWQENWERHVDVLSESVIGPLYRTTLSNESWAILKPEESFPFSVSRINQLVSLFIVLLWVGLAYRAFPFPHGHFISKHSAFGVMAAFTIAFLLLLIWRGWPRSKRLPRKISFDVAPFDVK